MGTEVATVPTPYVWQPSKEFAMNEDKAKGTAREVAGKAQEKYGEVTGNRKQQAKGVGKQVEGAAQKKVGDVKDAAHESNRKSH